MVSRRRSPGIATACLVLLLALPGASPAFADSSKSSDSPPALALVVDASGTMVKADVYPSRMAVAKTAAQTVLSESDAATVGLLTYGTSTGNSDADKPAGCQDVTTVVPVATLNDSQREALSAGVDGLKPSGYTPIGLALTRGAEAVNGAGTVVLISDGEDTCAPPDPCEVAEELKAQHPDLTISTVGFRTNADARNQLSCIAAATGGLFVSADDPGQLTRRLKTATNDAKALTTTGFQGIELGDGYRDIKRHHEDFPDKSTAKRYDGDVPGKDLLVIRYRDCDYVFSKDGRLVAIEPDSTVKTIDSLGPGSPVGQAANVLGEAEASEKNSDGTYTVYYRADPATGSSYRVQLSGAPDQAKSTIKTIVLCHCRPTRKADGNIVKLTETGIGDVSTDKSYREIKKDLIARLGEPDSIHDYTCEPAGFNYGETVGWGDFRIAGYGPEIGDIMFAGWSVDGPNTPVAMEVSAGLHLGEDKDDLARRLGLEEAPEFQLLWMTDYTGNGSPLHWWYDENGTINSVSTTTLCD